jgi:hypothetical protein
MRVDLVIRGYVSTPYSFSAHGDHTALILSLARSLSTRCTLSPRYFYEPHISLAPSPYHHRNRRQPRSETGGRSLVPHTHRNPSSTPAWRPSSPSLGSPPPNPLLGQESERHRPGQKRRRRLTRFGPPLGIPLESSAESILVSSTKLQVPLSRPPLEVPSTELVQSSRAGGSRGHNRRARGSLTI